MFQSKSTKRADCNVMVSPEEPSEWMIDENLSDNRNFIGSKVRSASSLIILLTLSRSSIISTEEDIIVNP